MALVRGAPAGGGRAGARRARPGPSEEARTAELAERVRTREEILSTIGDGIVLFAPDGRVAYANPAARDLLGRRFASAGEVTPESLRDAVAGARGAPADPVETEFETGGRTIEAAALQAGGGAVVVVARDRTAARQIERVRRDFVANASHELKTPVASIQALAETLRHAAPTTRRPGSGSSSGWNRRPSASRGWSATCSTCPGWRAASARRAGST